MSVTNMHITHESVRVGHNAAFHAAMLKVLTDISVDTLSHKITDVKVTYMSEGDGFIRCIVTCTYILIK